jgi:hypothetical protein
LDIAPWYFLYEHCQAAEAMSFRCFKVEKHDSGVKCLSAQLTLPCQFPFVPSAIRQSFDTQIVGSIESFAVPYDVLNVGRRSQANLTGYVKILDKIAVVRI